MYAKMVWYLILGEGDRASEKSIRRMRKRGVLRGPSRTQAHTHPVFYKQRYNIWPFAHCSVTNWSDDRFRTSDWNVKFCISLIYIYFFLVVVTKQPKHTHTFEKSIGIGFGSLLSVAKERPYFFDDKCDQIESLPQLQNVCLRVCMSEWEWTLWYLISANIRTVTLHLHNFWSQKSKLK